MCPAHFKQIKVENLRLLPGSSHLSEPSLALLALFRVRNMWQPRPESALSFPSLSKQTTNVRSYPRINQHTNIATRPVLILIWSSQVPFPLERTQLFLKSGQNECFFCNDTSWSRRETRRTEGFPHSLCFSQGEVSLQSSPGQQETLMSNWQGLTSLPTTPASPWSHGLSTSSSCLQDLPWLLGATSMLPFRMHVGVCAQRAQPCPTLWLHGL